MGYYTTYCVKVKEGDPDLISLLLDTNEYLHGVISEDGNALEECKWYDHEEEMKAFSEQHPEALFELKGEGEEAGDLWIKYFKNGKCQTCKGIITFEEFDENKLS